MKRMLFAIALAALGLWLASNTVPQGGLLAQEEPEKTGKAKGKPAAKEAKMMQCPMMAGLKGIKLFPDGPEALLAESKRLALSDKQIKQLKKIEQSAREKARAVLSDKQREELGKEPKAPVPLMELSRLRAMKMAKEDDAMMCPMCLKMMQKMKGKAKARADKDDD